MEEIVEVWKEIPLFNGKYLASNLGRIKSVPYKGNKFGRASEKVLSTSKRSKDGYALINLNSPEGVRKTYQVHRLIGLTFLDNYEEGLIINHKNEIKDDNRVDNLEWVTKKVNNEYNNKAVKSGLKLRNNSRSKSVIQYDKEMNIMEIYPSASEASRITNIDKANLVKCANTIYKTAGGFIWRYAES